MVIEAPKNSCSNMLISKHHCAVPEQHLILRLAKEFVYNIHIPFPLLPLRHMAGMRKFHPFDFVDPPEEGRADFVGHIIIFAIDDQRRDTNEVNLIYDIPLKFENILSPVVFRRQRVLRDRIDSPYMLSRTIAPPSSSSVCLMV